MHFRCPGQMMGGCHPPPNTNMNGSRVSLGGILRSSTKSPLSNSVSAEPSVPVFQAYLLQVRLSLELGRRFQSAASTLV